MDCADCIERVNHSMTDCIQGIQRNKTRLDSFQDEVGNETVHPELNQWLMIILHSSLRDIVKKEKFFSKYTSQM